MLLIILFIIYLFLKYLNPPPLCICMCDMYEQAVESLLEPAEGTKGAVAALKFGSPDITPALDVKEYYCQLAESLQVQYNAV